MGLSTPTVREETMGKLIYAIAAFGALAWSDPAWAVLQETTITLTDHGKPLPEATVTLNRLTDSQPPPQPKTEKTDDSGKVVLVHDKEDKKSDSTIELIVKTSEGETLTRRVVLRELLRSESIDVAVPSEPQEGSEAVAECQDLTHLDDPQLQEILTSLDDEQLQIIVDNPELRTRIMKLINESKQTEELQEKNTEERHKKHEENVLERHESQVHHKTVTKERHEKHKEKAVERHESQAHHESRTVAEHERHGRHYQESEARVPAHHAVITGLGIAGFGLGRLGGHHAIGGHHGGEE